MTKLVVWGPHDVAVHVRLGDILHGYHAAYRPLPMTFYRSFYRGRGGGRVGGVLNVIPLPMCLGFDTLEGRGAR